jgi:ketosteroid isomerase-like protein
MTVVLSNDADEWQVAAAALSQTPPMKVVRAELKRDAVVPPGMAGTKSVDATAKTAVDRFVRGLADQSVWGDDLSSRSDAIVIGPSAGDVTRGKTAIKQMWKKRAKANVRAAVAGDLTAAVTRDGELSWVTAPVVRFSSDDDPLPLREFAVFEKKGDDWTMIVLHEAVALDAPGAGAAYRKIQAPPAQNTAEPPPEKHPATKKRSKGPPPRDGGAD